jgi:hypothetical protein
MNTLLFIEEIKFLGMDVMNVTGLLELFLRFSFNILIIWILVRFLYYPITKRKDYLFTYIIMSSVIFLLVFLLSNVKLQMGFALGLFAIFGIIRYRTDAVPIKEMTYLFAIIGISVINALANKKVSYAELVATNLIILGLIYGIEKIWLLRPESCKLIIYEKIELIKNEKHEELLADLQQRTGLKINRIEVGKIDFLKDIAEISIFYFGDENRVNLTEQHAIYKKDSGDDD